MIKRLIEFYQRNCEGTNAMVGNIWRGVNDLYAPFCDALKTGDEPRVASLLNNMGRENKLYGLEAGKLYPFEDSWCFPYVQKLANMAGMLPYQHPNQPTGDQWKVKNIGAIIAAIESELGFSLRVPPCFGLSGEGVPLRMMMYHAPAALTIRRLMGVPNHILEIGAGLGNMGYIAKQWGVKTYTVLDLPHIAVLSAYFASKYCKEDEVIFHDAMWSHWDGHSYLGYDLIFNCDSLPEMPIHVQDRYIDLILEQLEPLGVFLSINHESDRDGQRRVRDAVKAKLKLQSRHPFSMMPGYVEEIYVRNS